MTRLWAGDFPLFFRNEPLHLLLDVLAVSDEEDELLYSIPRIRRGEYFPVSTSIQFLL